MPSGGGHAASAESATRSLTTRGFGRCWQVGKLRGRTPGTYPARSLKDGAQVQGESSLDPVSNDLIDHCCVVPFIGDEQRQANDARDRRLNGVISDRSMVTGITPNRSINSQLLAPEIERLGLNIVLHLPDLTHVSHASWSASDRAGTLRASDGSMSVRHGPDQYPQSPMRLPPGWIRQEPITPLRYRGTKESVVQTSRPSADAIS